MSDCPICMDVIEVNKNCVTTECGHCFHASCLMKNVAHNGFECPYCRHTMAEDVRKSYDDTYYDDMDDDVNTFESSVARREHEMNYALRGFRFMQNNLEGVPHDYNDLTDELYDDDDETASTLRTQELPDAAYIARRLFEDGFNVEQLIKCLLFRQEQYADIVDLEYLDNEFCDKVSKYIETFSADRHLYDDDEETKYDNYTDFKIQRHPSYIYDVNERYNPTPTSAPSYRCSTR